MKPHTLSKNLLPKLSISLIAISLFVLVACNESTAEQAKTNAEDAVQKSEPVAAAKAEVQQTEPVAATKAEVQQVEPIKETQTVDNVEKMEKKEIVVAETARSNQTNNNAVTAPKAPKFVEGKHYFEIFPQINTDAAKGQVEILELLWLGCPHCYKLEKHVAKYNKNKADYIAFKQVPAMLNRTWSKDAETFYMAQLLDPTGEKKLLSKIFHAIHEQGRRLKNEDSVKRYFAQLGISEELFNNTKKSMAYKVLLHRARQVSEASQISSVPSFIINGKYRTSVSTAGGEEKVFQLIEMLSAKERK